MPHVVIPILNDVPSWRTCYPCSGYRCCVPEQGTLTNVITVFVALLARSEKACSANAMHSRIRSTRMHFTTMQPEVG